MVPGESDGALVRLHIKIMKLRKTALSLQDVKTQQPGNLTSEENTPRSSAFFQVLRSVPDFLLQSPCNKSVKIVQSKHNHRIRGRGELVILLLYQPHFSTALV